MKLGLYADPHFSQTSSIIVGKRGSLSGRLNNLVQSFEWMNNLFKDNGVSEIICLGDLADKPVLTSEEISAMSQCNLSTHYILVGNHCRADQSGSINSVNLVSTRIISEPTIIEFDKIKVLFLPYSKEPYELTEKVDVILSHNDIQGYMFSGNHVCTTGYNLSDILDKCKLFINGHLHNGGWIVKDRAMNLGQLSGMNFSSCGGEWEPSVAILDTDDLSITLYENPVAYRFKKIEIDKVTKLKAYLDQLTCKGYILQVKVPNSISESCRKLLDKCDKVEASRVLTTSESKKSDKSSSSQIQLTQSSVYDKLKSFIKNQSNLPVREKILLTLVDELEKKGEGSI